MRFVHIVPERPAAAGSGAQIRGHGLARALSMRGEVVTVALSDVLGATGLRLARDPSFIEADVPEEVVAEILHQARPRPQDRVIVEGVYLAPVVRQLRSDGMDVILDAHNVESDLLRQTDLARHPVLARLQNRGRWRRAAEAERRILGSVSSVWACSTLDAERLRALAPGSAPVHVVPNPVPDWCLPIVPEQRPDGIDVLYVGHLGYRPNIAAARRLAGSILPAVRRHFPAARLTLAGRAPSKALLKAAQGRTGVTVVADPIDLAPLYARATMTLIPLTEGGGTRIKALEAMALGLPVVASAKAIEGLDITPGGEFLLAETDADFTQAAVRLSTDPTLRTALVAEARDFALRRHGPAAVEAAVMAALDGACSA